MWCYFEGKHTFKHRRSYCLANGKSLSDIEGIVIRHTCDNRHCDNAAHLIEGSQKDNCQDAVSRGRHSHGETHGCHKLTEAEVREIKRMIGTVRQTDLARRFNISKCTLSDIKAGRTWRHVDGPR